MNDSIVLDINRQQVFHFLGYRGEVEPSARIASTIDSYIKKASRLIRPSYSYTIKDIDSVKNNRVFIGNGIVFESYAIARLLDKCSNVAVFILSVGNRLEEAVSSLAERKRILEAYALDAIGSSITESLADFVQTKINDAAHKYGLCISRRFSPGYCDWDISQQRMVFQAMEGNLSGVQLTEDCLMLPQKSVSGIIGIGLCDNGVASYNPCKTCEKRNCLFRR